MVRIYYQIEMVTHVRISEDALARIRAMKISENETDAEALDRITKSLQKKAMDRAIAEGKKRWQIGE